MLLVAFMQEKVTCDSELDSELKRRQEACKDPGEDLIQCFNDVMMENKPPILTDLGFKFSGAECALETSASTRCHHDQKQRDIRAC